MTCLDVKHTIHLIVLYLGQPLNDNFLKILIGGAITCWKLWTYSSDKIANFWQFIIFSGDITKKMKTFLLYCVLIILVLLWSFHRHILFKTELLGRTIVRQCAYHSNTFFLKLLKSGVRAWPCHLHVHALDWRDMAWLEKRSCLLTFNHQWEWDSKL